LHQKQFVKRATDLNRAMQSNGRIKRMKAASIGDTGGKMGAERFMVSGPDTRNDHQPARKVEEKTGNVQDVP